ncbi:MAG TPA: VWA domain-containing protein [Thermoanaerobaculia bacterium]
MKRTLPALLILLSTVVIAQDKQVATAPYIETLEVRIHNLDVIVTDAKGKPVAGLTKDDFELRQDGTLQEITNFHEYAESKATSALNRSQTEQPAEEEQPEEARKKFVLFVDELNAHPHSRNTFAKNVTTMLERAMRPGDEVMVIRPAGEEKIALSFTTDPVLVRMKIDQAMKESGWRQTTAMQREIRLLKLEMGLSESQLEKKAVALRYADFVRRRVEQRLGNLRSVVTALSEVPGRKVVIVVSESLPSEPGREAFSLISSGPPAKTVATGEIAALASDAPTDYLPNEWTNLKPKVEEIARTASSSGITIYTLQPEYGIAVAAPGGADTRGQLSETREQLRIPGPITPTEARFMNEIISSSEQTFSVLTEKTGGKWFRGDGQIDDVFRQVANDVLSYYSLAYRASDEIDQPRRLEVRVKGRPELRVRTRDEVVRKSPQREMTDRVVASLLYPRERNELAIAVQASDPVSDMIRKNYFTTVDVLVPFSKLTFLPEGDVYRARFTVHYAASGHSIDFVSGEEAEQVVEIPAAEFQRMQEKYWRYSARMQMSQGRLKVAVGVLDSVSRLSGFQTVEVATK